MLICGTIFGPLETFVSPPVNAFPSIPYAVASLRYGGSWEELLNGCGWIEKTEEDYQALMQSMVYFQAERHRRKVQGETPDDHVRRAVKANAKEKGPAYPLLFENLLSSRHAAHMDHLLGTRLTRSRSTATPSPVETTGHGKFPIGYF